jgi:hypothetical protein
MWLGDLGPLTARLKWVKRGSAGLAFDTALTEEELESVKLTAVPVPLPQVVPLRRRLIES